MATTSKKVGAKNIGAKNIGGGKIKTDITITT